MVNHQLSNTLIVTYLTLIITLLYVLPNFYYYLTLIVTKF